MLFFKKLLNNIDFILDKNHSKEFKVFYIYFFFTMIVELIGIGLIVPFLQLVINENILQNFFLSDYIQIYEFSKQEVLLFFIFLILLVYSFKTLFLIYIAKKETKFIKNIRVSLAKRLFTYYLKSPYSFHLKNNSSVLIRNIQDIKYFSNLLINTLNFFIEGFILIGICVFLFIFDPLITSFSFGILILIGLLFNLTLKKQITKWAKIRQENDGLKIKNIQQGIYSIKDIKILNKENFFINLFNDSEFKTSTSSQNFDFNTRLPKILLEITAVTTLLFLVLIAIQMTDNFIDIVPTMGLFSIAAFKIFPSIARIVRSLQIIKFCIPVVNELKKEFSLSKINNKKFETLEKRSAKFLEFKNRINFKNISFSYGKNSNKIFENLNFEIKQGQIIGIYGESGKGKTTFINLLLGLLAPNKGKIIIDGRYLIRDNIYKWQSFIGYLPQETVLINDSLNSNIAFGIEKKQIDKQKINDLIKSLKLSKYLNRSSLDKIAEKGDNLSGGQKQRIGIARSLYHNPRVLIFDEPTSALDRNTAEEIIKKIYSFKRKKTIIIISHDKKILKKCDKIYHLKKNKLSIQ